MRSYFRRREFINTWFLTFYHVFNGWKVSSSFTPPENIPQTVVGHLKKPQNKEETMYYNRTISNSFAELIEKNGKLSWLFDFVKSKDDLDFLIGKNNSKEWISIYRGLSRVLTITKTKETDTIILDGAKAFKNISPKLYGKKSTSEIFEKELENLVNLVSKNIIFDRYYKNKKEGFYQNILSRKYGICGNKNDDFVIIDKEAVVGYSNQKEKDVEFNKIQPKYKQLQKDISLNNSKRYGKEIDKKAVGNELDFLALDKNGNILLIEYKHGTNTSGIYLSPIQIGMYYDIFTNIPRKDLEKAMLEMLIQKQQIGLINPNWVIPEKIKNIIPVLIISEYNYRSSAKQKFDEIFAFAKKQLGSNFLNSLLTYNYTENKGLLRW